MQVVDMQRTRMFSRHTSETYAVPGVEYTALLFWSDGQIDVRGLRERKAAEHGVSIGAAAANFDVGEIGAMPEPQEIAEKIYLSIGVGSFRVLTDFLQKHQIGIVTGDHLCDAHRIVTSVDASDAFMYVVGDNSKVHRNRELSYWAMIARLK